MIKEKIPLNKALENILKTDDSQKIEMIALSTFEDEVKKAGFEVKEDNVDYNGWQVDFWFNFYKQKEKYTLAGSLFYGGFEISHNTDYEQEDC